MVTSDRDVMTAAEIEAVRGKLTDHMVAHDFRSCAEKLLAHLDALNTPRDREALGREAFMAIHPGSTGETAWRVYETESRAPWIACAAHLHALGASSRQAEIDALRAELAAWRGSTGADSVEAYDNWRATYLDRVATARAEGAREEREACAAALTTLRKGSDPRATERIVAFDEAVDAIRERGVQ